MVVDAKRSELLSLERQFWDAMRSKDGATAERLTADECIVVGAQGVSAIDKKTMSELTTEGQWTLEHYEFDDNSVQVRWIDDDVALVAYKVKERIAVEGEQLTLEANDSSVWVQRNGDWLCAVHTESIVGDPFGRDRRA
jgi:hypothetical protein